MKEFCNNKAIVLSLNMIQQNIHLRGENKKKKTKTKTKNTRKLQVEKSQQNLQLEPQSIQTN